MIGFFSKIFVFTLIFKVFLNFFNFSASFLYSDQQIIMEEENKKIIKENKKNFLDMEKINLQIKEKYDKTDNYSDSKIITITIDNTKKSKKEDIILYPIDQKKEDKTK